MYFFSLNQCNGTITALGKCLIDWNISEISDVEMDLLLSIRPKE